MPDDIKGDDDSRFCGYCGARIIDDVTSVPAKQDPWKMSGSFETEQTDVQYNVENQNTGYYTNPGIAYDAEQNEALNNIQNYDSDPNINPDAGKSAATASLVLGIVSVVCWFFGYSALISIICGFIGISMAGKAKNLGYESGTRTAGFVLSLIGMIGGALVFVACVACVGSLGLLGASMY